MKNTFINEFLFLVELVGAVEQIDVVLIEMPNGIHGNVIVGILKSDTPQKLNYILYGWHVHAVFRENKAVQMLQQFKWRQRERFWLKERHLLKQNVLDDVDIQAIVDLDLVC